MMHFIIEQGEGDHGGILADFLGASESRKCQTKTTVSQIEMNF